MLDLNDKLNEFKLLITEKSHDGLDTISRHKIIIMIFYLMSFVLIFYHFATLDTNVLQNIQYSFDQGEKVKIPASNALSLGMFFYLYISFMAIVTLFTNGKVPNLLQKPRVPQLKRKYLVLAVISIVFFSSLTLFLVYLFVISTVFITIYLGPILFYIWMFLEPFFLLNGSLVFIDIINHDYPLKGYTQKSLTFLITIFSIGLFGPSVLAGLLGFNKTNSEFIDLLLAGLKISLYKPAIVSYSWTLKSIVFLSIIFMIIWKLKDNYRGKSEEREKKKGMLPWFVLFSLILLSISIIPIIATTTGDLAKLTSILDLVGLFLAILLGLWRVLGIEQQNLPIRRKWNPIEYINRINPYSKALFLLSMSIWGFYYSMENATIAAVTGFPDKLKIQELNLLAGLVGLAYIIVIWRYKGRTEMSSEPGVLKQAPEIFKTKVKQLKESF